MNTRTAENQWVPSVAMDADGDFVVVRQSAGQDGDSHDVYGQRYNALGTPQGKQFRVNTYTASNQWSPSAAMDTDGDFVVTWMSDRQDGSRSDVYGQRYSAQGAPLGEEFRVNTYRQCQLVRQIS